jgi:GBP family porin
LAALAATSAFAQSSVTVYGIVDVAYQSGTQEAAASNATPTKTKVSGLANSTMAGSRLGFKGTEDMGKGLKANFVAEMSLNALGDGFGNKTDGALAQGTNASTDALVYKKDTDLTTGSAGIFNRQTWAGLSGGFGEARVGYQNALQYDHNGSYAAGFEGMAGSRNHLDVLAAASLGNTVTNAEGGRLAGITYFAPAMGGVKLAGQWGASEVNQENGSQNKNITNVKASHYSVGATYAQGPLQVGAVHGNVTAQAMNNGLLTAAKEVDSTSTVYGASYDLTVAKLFAYYGDRKTTAAALETVKVNTSRFGVQVPMGNTKLIASYGTLTGKQADVKYSDRKFYQVGALQSLSKRTTLFALYGSDQDDQSLAGLKAGTAAAGGGSSAGTPADITTFRVGVNHSF